MYERMTSPVIKEYWQRKHDLPVNSWDHVNWKAYKQALKEQPRGTKHWFAKHCTGHCGVGRMMKLHKEWKSSRCARCGQVEETTVEVLQCWHPDADKQFETWKCKFKEWMEKEQTNPVLAAALLLRVPDWRYRTPHPGGPPGMLRELPTALREQYRIGWYNFLLGRVSL